MTEPAPPSPDDDEFPPWIDRAARLAGAIGLNPVRARWKLQRWHNRRRAARRRREQARDHVRYEHRVCPRCTAVNDRGATTCTRCGEGLHSRPRELLGRLGLHAPVPRSASAVLAVILVAVYVRTVIAAGSEGGWSIPVPVLALHGGNLPAAYEVEPWRFLTAVLLHGGVLHLAFNLISLAIVGPMIEELYGRLVTWFVFVTTGILASLVSHHTGLDGVGIGASGAIMGLIGAAAAAGHRAGTSHGRTVRDDMIKWALYVVVIGLMIGADNRAHVGGFVAGAVFGLTVPARWITSRAARPLVVVLGVLAIAATVAGTALAMAPRVSLWWFLGA